MFQPPSQPSARPLVPFLLTDHLMLSRALIQRLQPLQTGSAGEAGGRGSVPGLGGAGAEPGPWVQQQELPPSLWAGLGLDYVSSRAGATLVVQNAAVIKLALLSGPNSIGLHSPARQRSANSFSPGLLISFKPRYSACLTSERKEKKEIANK